MAIDTTSNGTLPDRWRAFIHRILTFAAASRMHDTHERLRQSQWWIGDNGLFGSLADDAPADRVSAFIEEHEAELAVLAADEPDLVCERLAIWSHLVTDDLLGFLGMAPGLERDPWGGEIRPGRIAVLNGTVELTLREFLVYQAFVRHRGQVLTREQLRELAWPDDSHVNENVVAVYVGYLRRKLGDDKIQTLRGVGYRMP